MILVTGGAGFIGSHIAERMQRKGVRILDNLSTGTLGNIRGMKVEFVKGNIRKKTTVESAMRDVHGVFHLAANVFPSKSVENPLFDEQTNIGGTLNLLEAARKQDVEYFIFSSSCSVYGDTETVPIREDAPTFPKSPYGIGKLACEHYLRAYYELHGLKTISLRYFNVYGERQNPTNQYSGVISKFIHNVNRNLPLEIFGNGKQMRDFISVEDVVEANLLSMKSKKWGISVNVGTGKSMAIMKIAKMVTEKKRVPIIIKEERPGDIRDSVADVRQAKKVLGFKARIDFSEGISRLLNNAR